MRYMGSLDGLGAIVLGDGSAALTIGNPHGDNVTTVILPVGQTETTAAVSISGWADYDEYGVTKSNYPQGVTYGWLNRPGFCGGSVSWNVSRSGQVFHGNART